MKRYVLVSLLGALMSCGGVTMVGDGGGGSGGSSGGGAGGSAGGGTGAGGGTAGGGTAGGAAGGGTAGGTAGGGTAGGGTAGTGGAGGTGGGTACLTEPARLDGGATLTIPTGSCAMPTCGGAIAAGTYSYTAACSDDPLADIHSQLCNNAMIKDGGVSTLQGQVFFDGCGAVRRQVKLNFTGVIYFPTTPCASLGCSALQSTLRNNFNGTINCSSVSGGCDCAVTQNTTLNEGGTYTTDAGTLVINRTSGAARRFNYCVTGDQLQLRETNVSNTEKGSSTLIKQ